jgi:hypothetical protein
MENISAFVRTIGGLLLVIICGYMAKHKSKYFAVGSVVGGIMLAIGVIGVMTTSIGASQVSSTEHNFPDWLFAIPIAAFIIVFIAGLVNGLKGNGDDSDKN